MSHGSGMFNIKADGTNPRDRIVVHGDANLVEQPEQRSYDPKAGWKTTRSWVGSKDDAKAFAATLARSNNSVSVDEQEGGIATVSVAFDDFRDGRAPRSADPLNGEPSHETDHWSLKGQDEERDLWQHPAIIRWRDVATASLTVGGTVWDYDALQKAVKDTKDKGDWQAQHSAIMTEAGSSLITFAQKLVISDYGKFFAWFKNGAEAYSISTYVLSRERTIANHDSGTWSIHSVNRTFTKNLLEVMEGMPASLKFGMPAYGQWLKRTPQISQEGIRWRMSQEWWHADVWDYHLYNPCHWAAGLDYKAGDLVTDNSAAHNTLSAGSGGRGAVYLCLADHTSSASNQTISSTTNWQLRNYDDKDHWLTP